MIGMWSNHIRRNINDTKAILKQIKKESLITLERINRIFSRDKLGGLGYIIKINESKFGRRKYNTWDHVEGGWVVSMVDRNSDRIRFEE